jgi:hypothetical protein
MWGLIRSDTVGKMTFLKISSPMLESNYSTSFEYNFIKFWILVVLISEKISILQFKEFR